MRIIHVATLDKSWMKSWLRCQWSRRELGSVCWHVEFSYLFTQVLVYLSKQKSKMLFDKLLEELDLPMLKNEILVLK